MKAAIYARKSTDDNDRDAGNKSVTRQVEHAKAYARKQGWTVEEHVYVDDGISGAEYVNRPGLARLMAALPKRGKPPFDVLVMSESSRLGRDMTRNASFIVDIVESDVRIFYYLTDEEEKANTPEQKFMLTARSYASEVERLKAGQRARAVLERKAQQGYCAGGACFGYSKVEVKAKNSAGEEARSHVDYAIDEQEARVVRQMFTMHAAGYGCKTIAKSLNGDPRHAALSKRYFGGARPASPRNGTGSWAPSSVRAMLFNVRYCGKVPYGRLRHVYRGGTHTRVVAGEPALADRADLRIISEALWQQVQDRLAAVHKTYMRDTGGKLFGRPGMGLESKYLLSGFSKCAACGGSMRATPRPRGAGAARVSLHFYECSYYGNRGITACSNNHRARVPEMDDAVLSAVERTVLTPEAVEHVVERAIALVQERRAASPDRAEQIERELRRHRKALDNLVQAIAGGTAFASVLVEIRKLEAAIAAKEAELQAHTMELPGTADVRALQRAAAERMSRFKDWLRADVPVARQALRKLLADPIQFVPTGGSGGGYTLRGATQIGPLFDACLRMVPRKGFEPPQCCHR